jgi:GT2 family glycosyltransferase
MTPRAPHVDSAGRPVPRLSVVVPAYQAAATLGEVLAGLAHSDLPRDSWELIVVDDASTDDTAVVASHHADAVIRLPDVPRGPAYCRNRGFELARASLVAFIDADVLVGPRTLREMVERLESDVSLSALGAVMDDDPRATNFISRFRNLRRRAMQLRKAGDPSTLWGGCCAVRRAIVALAGHFDEWHFAGPQDELGEFALRVVRVGGAVAVDTQLEAKHLKRFSLRTFLFDDLWRRRIVHVRLAPGTSKWHVSEGLVWLAIALLVVASAQDGSVWAIAAGVSALGAVLAEAPLLAAMIRMRGPIFGFATIPVQLLTRLTLGAAHFVGAIARHAVGAPRPDPTAEAYSEIGLEGWPPPPYRPRPADPRVAAAGGP